MKSRKTEFDTTDADGAAVKLAVCRPTARQKQEAELAHAAFYAKAVTGGVLLRQQLVDVARERKIWNDAKESEYRDILGRVDGCLKRLPDAAGKVRERGVTAKVAYRAAVELRTLRGELNRMIGERMSLDSLTAESLADELKLDHLTAACTVWADGDHAGEAYFASVDDYHDRQAEPAAREAKGRLSEFVYDLNPRFQHDLPENQFLVKNGFADPETLRLVKDEDGKPLEAAGAVELFDMAFEDSGQPASSALLATEQTDKAVARIAAFTQATADHMAGPAKPADERSE